MTEQKMKHFPTVAAGVGLLLAVTGFVVSQVVETVVGDAIGVATRVGLSLGAEWVVAGVAVALVLYWERRSLSSIGIHRPTVRTVGLGVGAFVIGVVIFPLTTPVVEALGLGTTEGGIGFLGQLSVWMLVAIAVTAGVTEEILFRGYLLERVGEAAGALWVGAVVSAILFTLLHVPLWGVGGALQIGVWTIIVTVLYVRTRDLGACILMHVLNDLFAFIVIPILFL